MTRVYPDYYNEFKCINKDCKHNCCIGWEIDIDYDTFSFYDSIKGDFGNRLKNNIDDSDIPHFILKKDERCPFLNDQNLCDIIITLGEDSICDICKEHPRFHNSLPTRIESGLGLCCEEAARIILGKKDPVNLIIDGEDDTTDEIIILRDKVIELLQNRSMPIEARITQLYNSLKSERYEFDLKKLVEILLALERLDNKWTEILLLLKQNLSSADYDGFEKHITNRITEYEQLLVYIIYRYFSNSFDIKEAFDVVLFADFVYKLIFSIGAVMYTVNGDFTFTDQIELVRMFSSEIEYSDQNIEIIFKELSK